jgi:hypothetical protein
MAFVSERRMHLAPGMAAGLAHEIDGAPRGEDGKPSGKWSGRIIGLACPVDGQQGILNHVVDPIGGNTLPPRHLFDHAHAVAQQRPVGLLIARLRRRHPGATPRIIGG